MQPWFCETAKQLLLVAAGTLLVLALLAAYLGLAGISLSVFYILHGIGCIIISSIVVAVLYGWYRHAAAAFVVCYALSLMSVCTMFFVLVPVTIERSVSVYLMDRFMQAPEAGYDKHALEHFLASDYLCHRDAINKRMEEQQVLGMVAHDDNGHFHLTGFGRQLGDGFWVMRRLFSIPERGRGQACSG